MRRTGRDLFLRGLVSTRGGNLSVRDGDAVHITRTGAPLGRLVDGDIVVVPGPQAADASSDLAVHEAIHDRHGPRAVVHTHGVEITALSLVSSSILPVDHEGALLLGEVPIVDEDTDRTEVGRRVAAAGARIVVVRGHGTYAWGDSLDDAAQWTTALEMSAAILLRVRGAGG